MLLQNLYVSFRINSVLMFPLPYLCLYFLTASQMLAFKLQADKKNKLIVQRKQCP